MARWTAPSTIAALLVVVSPAWAQHLDPRDGAQPGAPPIDQRVHFALDFRGVPGCGERALFEDALRIQMLLLGSTWDPFAPVSRWPLKVRITRSNGWFEGKAEVYGPDGRYRGTHTMPGPLSCYDVIAGLTSALATDATPLRAPPVKHPEPAAPCPEAKSCPTCDSPSAIWPEPPPLRAPEPDPPKPPERPFMVRVGASVWPELVVTGWGSLGFSAEAGVRYRFLSVAVEAHGDPPLGSATFHNAGALSFARISGALLICGHFGWFVGCGVMDAGGFVFTDRPQALPASAFYSTAGARAGLEFPIVPSRFFIRTALDVRAPILPARYTFHGASLFEAAGLGVGFGIGVLAELPP